MNDEEFYRRMDALAMNLELLSRDREADTKRIEEHYKIIQVDAENIRALARIAEIHERRLTTLEGQEPL